MLKNPHELQYIQSRAEMNFTVVDEYAKDMEEGLTFEAVKGLESPEGAIWIWDGAHRIEAAKRAGCFVDVELKPGSKDDAEWAALSANTTHGLRRSPADIERVVKHALHHAQAAQKSDREIARHCGVSPTTVGKYRKETASVHAGQIQRTVTRGDSTYQMTIPDRTAPKEETPEESGRKWCTLSILKNQRLSKRLKAEQITVYKKTSNTHDSTEEEEESGEEERFQQILEQCQSALERCFFTKRGITKIYEVNDIMGLVRGVTYPWPPGSQKYGAMTANFKLEELLYEVSLEDWERAKQGKQAPEETPELDATPVECDFCQNMFEETEVYEVEVNCSIICKGCAEKAYRELSAYASSFTEREALDFDSADRKKIQEAGFQIYRVSWGEKRLKRNTGQQAWVKVEDFPTKKAMKERIQQLSQDPNIVFDGR